jgi:transposase
MSKNQSIIDLHRAQVPIKIITETLCVSRATVYRVLKNGNVDRKKRVGSWNKKLDENFLKKVSKAVEADPTLSIRKQAKKLKVSDYTVRKGLKMLGKKSIVRPPAPLLTERLKKLRFERSKRLLNILKKDAASTVRIFSDKKVFTVDQVYNRRNDRIIVNQGTPATPVITTKHPAGCMVLGIVASDGQKCPAIFVPEGVKVNSDAYIELLKSKVVPWLKKTYPKGNYVWQQDGAPAHTSKKTQAWLAENMSMFWDKTIWPPSSPDLNPLDFSVWSVIEAKACKVPHSSVAALKDSIAKAWRYMSKDYLKRTCAQFRARIEKVIEMEGGLFEKL